MNLFEGVEGQVNLKTIFNKCNKEYFDGMMPSCKVEWSGRIKRAIGRAHVKYRGVAQKNPMGKYLKELPQSNIQIDPSSLTIQMSKSFDMTKDDITAVMLHEMVHILLFSQRKISGHHGTNEFDGWIKKLRRMSGLNVPFLESDFKTSPKLKAKKGFVLIGFLAGGDYGYCTYSENFLKKNWMMFAKTLGRYFSSSSKYIKAEMYIVAHPVVSGTTPRRNLKKLRFYDISDEAVKEIVKTGKLIFQTEYGKGGWIDANEAGFPQDADGPIHFDTWGEWIQ